MLKKYAKIALLSALPLLPVSWANAQDEIQVSHLQSLKLGEFGSGAAEIPAFDPASSRAFVTNGAANSISVTDVSESGELSLNQEIDMTSYGAGVNSVAVANGIVAVAVEAEEVDERGKVVFFNTDGEYQAEVAAGFLPDMLTFNANGSRLLVANEGEPNDEYTIDPEGSVSVIDIPEDIAAITQDAVREADFRGFNAQPVPEGARIFGPGATVAQDLEPEYIAISQNTAYVVCQENNALVLVDISSAKAYALVGLGYKDHSLEGNGFDASNRSDEIEIIPRPTLGMYQPDAIASYRVNNETYIVSANEGDARDYDGFSEETRVEDLQLDPDVFPNAAELQAETNLGRLKTTTTMGDANEDGFYEEIYSYGARSFSIWNADGELVFDSGDFFEQELARLFPDDFNANDDENERKSRSDDKGPEPEGVVLGEFNGKHLAFIGLERTGGFFVFDVSNPEAPEYLQYVTTRNFDEEPGENSGGDLSPEGLAFVSADESPTGSPLVIVTHEVSGTVALFELSLGTSRAEKSGALLKASAYPNPAADYVIVNTEEAADFIVTNLGGQTVASGAFVAGMNTLDVSALASGVYVLELRNENGRYAQKVSVR